MATVTLLHVLGVLFGAAMCYRAWTFFDAATERPLAFVVWAGFGTGLLAYTAGDLVAPVALHGALAAALGAVGIAGWPALVSVTLAGVTMLTLYTYTRVRAGDRQLAEAQQEIALLRYEVEYGGRARPGDRDGAETGASGGEGTAAATRRSGADPAEPDGGTGSGVAAGGDADEPD